MGARAIEDVTASGAPLAMGDHVIAVYRSQEQRWGILTPFLTAGLRLAQRTLVICADSSIGQIRNALGEAGTRVDDALAARQLRFAGPLELPVRETEFDDEMMMRYVRAEAEAAQAEGWSSLRVAAETPWFVNETDIARLLRFEGRLTRELHQLPAIMMCLYNMAGLTPGTVTDLLRTHPLVVIGDRVVENELYAAGRHQPDDYVPRLH